MLIAPEGDFTPGGGQIRSRAAISASRCHAGHAGQRVVSGVRVCGTLVLCIGGPCDEARRCAVEEVRVRGDRLGCEYISLVWYRLAMWRVWPLLGIPAARAFVCVLVLSE